jgi:hypothetical protein
MSGVEPTLQLLAVTETKYDSAMTLVRYVRIDYSPSVSIALQNNGWTQERGQFVQSAVY